MMAELVTLARPYAEALFQAAEENISNSLASKRSLPPKGAHASQAVQHKHDTLSAWSKWLNELAHIATLPEVSSIAAHPKVRPQQVTELLLSAVKSPAQSLDKQTVQNFVQLIVDHRRLSALPEIAAQFERLKNARKGVADALIVSAFALDNAQLEELVAKLEHKFGCKLKPHLTVDASLIGGVCIRVGDQVLDASIRAQLARMQTTLTA